MHDYASDEADFACLWHAIAISCPADAAHGYCDRVLRVVGDQEDDRGNDGPHQLVACPIIRIQIEVAREAWITAHMDEVEAVEDHEIDDEQDKEERDIADCTLVETLAREYSFLEAAPLWIGLRWSEHG